MPINRLDEIRARLVAAEYYIAYLLAEVEKLRVEKGLCLIDEALVRVDGAEIRTLAENFALKAEIERLKGEVAAERAIPSCARTR